MSSSPKIMVFRLREIVYTFVLILFVILLIFCLVLMFAGKSGSSTDSSTQNVTEPSESDSSEANPVSAAANTYASGIYTASLSLGDSVADVQISVESGRIKAIDLVNLSEATKAAWPLVSDSFENITSQILEKQKLDGITCSAESRYTSQLLLNAISKALKAAQL